MGLENNGPLPGRPVSGVSGRAARRAEGAAQAWPMLAGRASPGTVQVGSGRAWAGPKNRAHGRAVGFQAAWTLFCVAKPLPRSLASHCLPCRRVHAATTSAMPMSRRAASCIFSGPSPLALSPLCVCPPWPRLARHVRSTSTTRWPGYGGVVSPLRSLLSSGTGTGTVQHAGRWTMPSCMPT